MLVKHIRKADVAPWLRDLAREAMVFVPTARPGGDVVLEPLAEGDPLLDFGRLTESPKRILFPQNDPLLRWQGQRAEPVLDTAPRILFGLRPCDAAALVILDEFFRRRWPDPNYLARRSATRLIVLVCRESQESCFCSSAGTGPVLAEGFDVQMFEDGDGYVAEAGSAEGERMMARGGRLFHEAPADWPARRDALAKRLAGRQPHLDLGRAAQLIRDHGEPEGFWQGVARRCLICGGCAYLCPTCTCYTFFDRPEPEAVAAGGSRGRRIRAWDSCVLEGFTREAAGHNPRPELAMRCARRYEHKLGGSDVACYRTRCVGCGRCVETCLSRLGMIRVVRELLNEEESRRGPGSRGP